MTDRRRLARERLEIYLVYLILMYRQWFLISGLLFLAFAVMTTFVNGIAGFSGLMLAIYLLLLSNSYNFVVFTARMGAWIGTLWEQDE